MRRGLLAGLIVGGMLGTYYGMSLNNRGERHLQRMADEFLDRSGDMMDKVRDRASRMMPMH